jgi:hypothetical protein
MKSAAFFAYADNYLIDVKHGIRAGGGNLDRTISGVSA